MRGTTHGRSRVLGKPSRRPREFTSRKVLTVLGVPAEEPETLGFWVEAYLTAAVHGVRSQEVTSTIARHLARFRDWFTDGPGHDRIAALTAREITLWGEHLAATVVRTVNTVVSQISHANDGYLRLYTNPSEDVAASWAENL